MFRPNRKCGIRLLATPVRIARSPQPATRAASRTVYVARAETAIRCMWILFLSASVSKLIQHIIGCYILYHMMICCVNQW